LRRRRVKALLMGGQACILYGAAEFSRDVDLAVAVEVGNLSRLRAALDDLDAEPVYFPTLSAETLNRGHACHFRCRAPGLENVRVDVIAETALRREEDRERALDRQYWKPLRAELER
jgi:hypothetical protein